MISEFTPPGIKVIALRGDGQYGVTKGDLLTVRGMVINRHWRTREPDPHVLFEEISMPIGTFGEIGWPRDAFDLPSMPGLYDPETAPDRELEDA